MLLVSSGFSAFASLIKLIIFLILFVGLLIAAWAVTRWYGKSGFVKGRYNNLEIIDTASLGQAKNLNIVRIGKKYVAIAVCKDQVTKLMELDEDDINLVSDETETFKNISFKDMLTELTVQRKNINNNDEKNNEGSAQHESEDKD